MNSCAFILCSSVSECVRGYVSSLEMLIGFTSWYNWTGQVVSRFSAKFGHNQLFACSVQQLHNRSATPRWYYLTG